jgi:hypothetical protein
LQLNKREETFMKFKALGRPIATPGCAVKAAAESQ